ncbi:hypothetical protein GYMLUDRAFT_182424, partial [Collybiopsis luxurians FD-317 M1]
LFLISSGFYTLLFGLSCYFLYRGKNINHHKLHLAWIISLFLITTLGGLISASSGLDDLVVAYTAVRTQNFAPNSLYIYGTCKVSNDKVGCFLTVQLLTHISSTITDSVLIHRIFLVWGSNVWIIVFPILSSLATNGMSFDLI